MATGVGNIRIEPVNVRWEIEEQWQVKTVADSSDSLGGTYFTMDSPTTQYYVWFDTGASVDPAPSGRTGITVTISTDDTANAVASAMQTAVDAEGDFQATVDGDEVTITNVAVGEVADTADNDTGFTFTQCQEGGTIDLGLLDGDVEASFEEQTQEITAHQTGTTLRADLRQGVSAEVSLTLKETDLDKLKEMFSKGAGGTHTPSGGTELFGWGDVRQGTNTIVQARKLIFHPVALDSGDLSRDLTFWKAYPLPDSLTFSGENPNMLSMTFKTYLDGNKPQGINMFAFGDHTQLDPA